MVGVERIAGRRVVASISGGADSAAMSLWLAEQGIPHDRVFLDTGWEHDRTYEYLRGELTQALGPIVEIRGPHDMEGLIRKKGTFPSRRRRFCTEELKVRPMIAHLRGLMDGGCDVVNAVGIRADESESRGRMTEWEWKDEFDCETWRPLLRWTKQDVIDIHRRHGLRPNPLYLMGALRVGCWPCIYARKSEIRLVADKDPARIVRLRVLEDELTERSGGQRGWFQAPISDGGEDFPPWPIDRVVEWSRTVRGGREEDRQELLFAGLNDGCMRWGLCDTRGEP